MVIYTVSFKPSARQDPHFPKGLPVSEAVSEPSAGSGDPSGAAGETRLRSKLRRGRRERRQYESVSWRSYIRAIQRIRTRTSSQAGANESLACVMGIDLPLRSRKPVRPSVKWAFLNRLAVNSPVSTVSEP
jgi:hypothetical protein